MLRVTRKKRKGEEKESESFPLGIEIWGIFNGQPFFVYIRNQLHDIIQQRDRARKIAERNRNTRHDWIDCI